MQKFITAAYLLAMAIFSQSMFGQVGINTKTPNATLDITPKTTDGSKPEGLLIPQLDGNSLNTTAYGTAQKGVIVYAKSAASPTDTKTVNVTAEGYYYFDGSVWQKMTGAVAGDTTNDAWINDTANGLVKLGTKADGTARTAGTDIVVKDNGSIGIGTGNPAAALDINSTVGTFVAPRMSTTQRDALVLPPKGSLIYNLDINKYEVNLGTNAAPFWDQLNTATSPIALKGSIVDAPTNIGDTSPVISIDNLKFRLVNSNSANLNNAITAYIQFSTASGTINTTFRYLWGYNSSGYVSTGGAPSVNTTWQNMVGFGVRDYASYIQGILTDSTNKTMYRFTFYCCGAGVCGAGNIISFVVEKII
ncbi:hypothetical protein [Chryseobacterium taeanense]|uniref:hypothetical protein n=1 Tax=Chryseobacterium taeanense TaxID=311334 RepID=UPI0035B24B64